MNVIEQMLFKFDIEWMQNKQEKGVCNVFMNLSCQYTLQIYILYIYI